MNKKLVILSSLMILALLVFSVSTFAARYDFGGRTVILGGLVNPQNYEEGKNKAHLENIEEQFNVNIEFKYMTFEDLTNTVRNSVLAGDPVADILVTNEHQFDPLAADNVLMPLDDILGKDYYESLPESHRNCQEYTTVAGTTYGFSMNWDMASFSHFITWNKDMFEREGLPDLYELQESGEWTWDKLTEFAKKLTRDTNGDGEVDQWGIQSPWNVMNWVAASWTFVSNDIQAIEEVDGQMTFRLDQPAALETLKFLQELITVHNVVPPVDAGSGTELFINGQLGMNYSNNYMAHMATQKGMEEDYGVVFFPKGPRADEYVGSTQPWVLLSLTLGAEQPAALIELANAFYELTDDYTDIDEYNDGIVEWWMDHARDRETIDSVEQFIHKWKPIRYWHGQGMFGTVVGPSIDAVINGQETPKSAMEAIKPEAQSWIDDFFQQ